MASFVDRARPVRFPQLSARRWLAGADRRLLCLLALAAAVRIAYWAVFLRDYAPLSDAAHYHQIAQHVAEGRGFVHWFPQIELHPTAFRPPLFPLTLAVAYAVLWPAVGLAQGVNLVLGVVAVGLTYAVTREVGGRSAATAAGAIVAVYPPLVANDVVPLAESLGVVLLLSLALALRRGALGWVGVLTGLLVLDRTSAQAVVVLVGAWVWLRMGARKAVGTLALAGLVILPWVVRNAVELGQPVLVTSNGFNLAAIHSPEARATGHFVDPVFDGRFERFRLAQFDEVEWDHALAEHATDEITRDPLAVLGTVRRNALAMLELEPHRNESAERLDGRDVAVRTAGLPLFAVVSTAGMVGLWRFRRDPTVLFLALVAGYFATLSLVLVAPPRLRWPFDLLCAIGAGLLVSRARQPARTPRQRVEPREREVSGTVLA
jgi:hypothetical protein